uniref:Uncharacterized protein n=1 Tax=Micrurus corallinus TaxID=54390 RepID=A0A2D4G7H3_MICCO
MPSGSPVRMAAEESTADTCIVSLRVNLVYHQGSFTQIPCVGLGGGLRPKLAVLGGQQGFKGPWPAFPMPSPCHSSWPHSWSPAVLNEGRSARVAGAAFRKN